MSRTFDVLKRTTVFKWLVYLYVRVLFSTYRIDISLDTKSSLEEALHEGLFYFWRRDIISAIFFLVHHQTKLRHLVADRSPDGELAAYVAGKLGFKILYGTSRPSYIKKTLDILDMNHRLAMIGDGASNKTEKLQRELLYLSARSAVPLVHIHCRSSWAVLFKQRWDQLRVPLPFSTIHVTLKKPVEAVFDQKNDPVLLQEI